MTQDSFESFFIRKICMCTLQRQCLVMKLAACSHAAADSPPPPKKIKSKNTPKRLVQARQPTSRKPVFSTFWTLLNFFGGCFWTLFGPQVDKGPNTPWVLISSSFFNMMLTLTINSDFRDAKRS